jgi:hypothetical protein
MSCSSPGPRGAAQPRHVRPCPGDIPESTRLSLPHSLRWEMPTENWRLGAEYISTCQVIEIDRTSPLNLHALVDVLSDVRAPRLGRSSKLVPEAKER